VFLCAWFFAVFVLAVWHTLAGISGAVVHKKNQSESDISDKFIRPAIVQAGWHMLDQIYAQYPLRAGRVVVRGKTAKRPSATRPPFSLLTSCFALSPVFRRPWWMVPVDNCISDV
jgi:hypothetical protein